MTVKINADTSDGLKFVSDTSGERDLQIDASTKVHMDSSGNVGIGTTSPSGALQIGGTDSTLISGEGTGDRDFSTDTFGTIDIPSFSLMNQVGATYKNISGLGMNFTNGVLGIVNNYQYTGGGKIAFYTGTKTSTGGSLKERMKITTAETFVFGRDSASAMVIDLVDGTGDIILLRNGGSTKGTISTNGSTVSYNTSSDYRLKENVNYTFDATTEVKKLKPCKFNFKDESDTVEGFLAHEVSDVVPIAVTGTKDATKEQNVYDDNGVKTGTETVPDYQGIDQSKLVPLLVKTIQELEARITALES